MLEQEEKDARLWATLCHLSAFAAFLGMPFGNIIGPLVVWLIKRKEFVQVEVQGKKAINFQITITLSAIVIVVAFLLTGLVSAALGESFRYGIALVPLGFFLLPLLFLFDLIVVIIASIKASEGKSFHYPFSIRFIV